MPEKESKVERTEDNYSQEISLVNTFLVPWGNAAALHAGLKYTEHPEEPEHFRPQFLLVSPLPAGMGWHPAVGSIALFHMPLSF